MRGIIQTFHLTSNGLEPVDVPGDTLDQVSLHLPQGTYTTFRTYDHDKFLRIEDHLRRLEESARLVGHECTLDHTQIRRAIAEVLARTGYPESRFRVTTGLNCQPELYISVEQFEPLPETVYDEGVATATMVIAREQPEAKVTTFIAPSREIKRTAPPGIFEVLMVSSDGKILEGFSSNFFAVRDGILYTAREGVLRGITRSLVLEVATPLLPIQLQPVQYQDIPALSEAFLTSSSREVVPVVKIDRLLVGSGRPGPVARELLRRYRNRVREEIQPIL